MLNPQHLTVPFLMVNPSIPHMFSNLLFSVKQFASDDSTNRNINIRKA